MAGFEKFFLFWIAVVIILEALDVELERAHSCMFQFCYKAVLYNFQTTLKKDKFLEVKS